MNVFQALKERRTIRSFAQKPLPESALRQMIDAARMCSCASNRQRLRYIAVQTPETVKAVFEQTAWAGLVKPRRTPVWGKNAPAAFIAVLGPENSDLTLQADAGGAIQSMQLAAWELGIGCCWMGAINRKEICRILEVPEGMELLYVVAAGFPQETPVSEESAGAVAYYLDDNDRLHVPKLSVDTITVWK